MVPALEQIHFQHKQKKKTFELKIAIFSPWQKKMIWLKSPIIGHLKQPVYASSAAIFFN